MKNVFESKIGGFTGNGSFQLSLDVEMYRDGAKLCPHAKLLQVLGEGEERILIPALVSIPSDDGDVALVCLHCLVKLADEASADWSAQHKLIPRK